jgi:hypothetical protein
VRWLNERHLADSIPVTPTAPDQDEYDDEFPYHCIYCGRGHNSPNGTGSDVACCGEVGHIAEDVK